MDNITKFFVANKAFLINPKGELLVVREGTGDDENTNVGKWDVPGGRMQPGESPLQALKREVKEEVGIDIVKSRPFYLFDVRPIIKEEPCQIVIICHAVEVDDVRPVLSNEHDQFKWINPREVNRDELIGGLYEAIQEYLTLGGD